MDDDQRSRRPWDRVLPGITHGPSWARALLLRRALAAVLAVAALVVALLPDPADERLPVLVAAHDLAAGSPIGPADVAVSGWPAALVPGGVLRTVAEAGGRVPAGPVRAGEPITDLRLVGPGLAERTGGPGASAVPVRPADPAVAALLTPGTRVDVIAGGPEGPRVLAARAGVVAVLPDTPAGPGSGTGTGPGPLVLVALPEAEATAVAAATLAGEVTVTLR
ncbi:MULTISPECIES: SAF domain-containing protein [Pseudonocardia]|uniref:SAF domain protein n=2 Tax=Pseudonocardia TaxID=1847 RepID=A0A1Y2MKT9_PSEAH|nr:MULTISPECIES: SAF domain-containing protein [Pseudonocardia]OSY35661.1 SAF domain protein [Pseudonocardia autotrophica]TDN75729.1 Flp pilus assembly protein CpaB [Pseudonocardia autotrophica]BBF99698.1 hypothetical protein Pdca_09080 [Pseudonocardia autotrophica]GEC27211.1 hypothetical protein PSA01_42400 [Pseudonocardia saturnea]